MSPSPRKRPRALRPHLDWLDDRCLLSGLTPAQVAGAYGLNAITFKSGGQSVAGDGAGQTIAIVDAFHDPDLASDLATFDARYGLKGATLTQVNQSGGASTGASDDGWAGEETLDVEWAHAIAPGASIVVVEANSDSTADMMAAVATARSLPGVSVVSMSWGGAESADQTQYDSTFTTPAGHVGITFVAASGDQGSAGGAEWPAASPNVLSVGGTSLSLNASGGIASETTWSGSSGGYSRYEAEPSYQESVQTTGRRSTPDVAFDADPSTGVSVYATAPSTGQGTWETVGGTSLGAPAWAAIIAIADQGRVDAGLGTLDGASQTLPALYAAASTDYNTSSLSSTSTSSGAATTTTTTAAPSAPGSGYGHGGGFHGGRFGGFAGTGFGGSQSGVASALGSPIGSLLISSLVAYTGTSSASTGSGSTTSGTGTGSGSTTTGSGTGSGSTTSGTGSGSTGTPTGLPTGSGSTGTPTTTGTGSGSTGTPTGTTTTHVPTHGHRPSHTRTAGSHATHIIRTVTRSATITHRSAARSTLAAALAASPSKPAAPAVAVVAVVADSAAPSVVVAPIGLTAAVQIGGLLAEAAMIAPNDLILAASAPLQNAFRSPAQIDAALRSMEDDDEA